MTSKPATIALLIGIFVAGGATGGVLTATYLKRGEPSGQRGPARLETTERFADQQLERLTRVLGLTPEQRGQVEPITRQTGEEVERLRREVRQGIHQRIQQMYQQIGPLLTPEQQPKLEAHQKEQMNRLRRPSEGKGPGRGRPPGPEAPPRPPPAPSS